MTCKHCGTEVAANALICFRCGRPTAEATPGRTAQARRPTGGSRWVTIVAAVILIVAALYMGQSTYGQIPRPMAWTLAGLAALVLAWRIWRRGRT